MPEQPVVSGDAAVAEGGARLAAPGPAQIAAFLPRIRSLVRWTPVLSLDRAELGLGPGPLVLKLEQLQHTGSFKPRGAFANLLLGEVPPVGVVAASGGNHGAAVAYAARALGLPATIFVPEVSSPAKLARIKEYGAELVVVGQTYDEARRASAQRARSTGALDVPAFDAPATILGTGSIAVELQEQVPDAETVLASVGGGGLLAGLCAGFGGAVRVIGVEPESAPTLSRALVAGGPVDAAAGGIAVDSLAPRRIGAHTFPVIAALGAGAVLVSDEAIAAAQQLLWDRLRLVLEPGGCAAFAALASGRYRPGADEHVVVVLSGANTTAVDFGR